MFWAARALHWCIQRVWPALRGVGNLLNLHRAGDRLLELLILNEEFLVSVSHQLALITSLPFVHTARRSYRLNGPVKCLDCEFLAGSPVGSMREVHWTLSFRGRRSRNKVSVGEPAEGSFTEKKWKGNEGSCLAVSLGTFWIFLFPRRTFEATFFLYFSNHNL